MLKSSWERNMDIPNKYLKRGAKFRVSSFLLSAILLLFSCIASAQNFRGGFLAGITTSQVDGDEHSGFHKCGGFGGVFVVRNTQSTLPNHIFELTFSQKGASFPESNGVPKFSTTIDYIDATYLCDVVPNHYFDKFPQSIHFQIGTSVSSKVYEKALLDNVKQNSNDFNRIDWTAHIGVSQQINVFDVELRALHSIIPNSGRYYNFALILCVRANVFGI